MSKCVIFRVDANPSVGLGHLMRCLAVAQGFTSEGIKVVFAIAADTEQYCQSRDDWVGDIVILPLASGQSEPVFLSALCQELEASWLILDGYNFDIEYRNQLNISAFKLGIFDDGLLCDTQLVDSNLAMVINWANGADVLPYEKYAPNATLCASDEYRVLRREFYDMGFIPYEQRSSLLLMFGGSDPFNFTLPLLQALAGLNTNLPITVITGAGYQTLSELNSFVQSSSLEITHHHNSQNIAQIMGGVRLAVSAAGASQFELLRCLTPSLFITVADNQIFATLQAAKQGWCDLANTQNLEHGLLVNEIAKAAIRLWEQPEKLSLMHQNAKKFSNPSGIQGIIEAMI